MDDSGSDIFFTTRTGQRFTAKHVILVATASVCAIVFISGIIMISSGSTGETDDSGSSPKPVGPPSCPDTALVVADRCFQFAETKNQTNWSQAREYCIQKGGDLAVLDDCHVMQRVIGYIHANAHEADEGFWVGGTDQSTEGSWNWINGKTFQLGTPFWGTELRESFKLEPAGSTGQNCLQLYGPDVYTFHDGTCSDYKSSICEAQPFEGRCNSGYEKVSNRCFKYVTSTKTWSSAQSYCQSNGGELAMLKECHIFADVVYRLKTLGYKSSMRSVWLGGNDKGFENIWTWTDGSIMTLGAPFWGKDKIGTEEPNGGYSQNCAAILKKDRYFFHDVDCNTNHGFSPLCEFEPK